MGTEKTMEQNNLHAQLQIIREQSLDSHNWINRMIHQIPEFSFFEIPSGHTSNIAWQLGHLTLSQYYYGIVLSGSPNKEISQKIPLKLYSEFFAKGTKNAEIASAFTQKDLLFHWLYMMGKVTEVLEQLKPEELQLPVTETGKPHPFVKTKQEALSWNMQHNMMHVGQLATLRRLAGMPFDYGM